MTSSRGCYENVTVGFIVHRFYPFGSDSSDHGFHVYCDLWVIIQKKFGVTRVRPNIKKYNYIMKR